MLLVIDNYDSFTYNLVQYLGELGAEVVVRRNDAIGVEEVGELHPSAIVLSPGPCTPKEAGVTVEVIRRWGSSVPMLGVCLGHQAIGEAYGGDVVRAERVMHGKTSQICHNEAGIFTGLPSPMGLVKVKSSDPRQLKHDHQVLAYGYDLQGEILKLRLYDPNQPGRDDVTLSLCIADPSRPTAIATVPPTGPVYAFFRVRYWPTAPP